MSRLRRRNRELEEEKRDRWLVSYADFITLLFALFVVMYSISSVNEGKYRVLSDSLSSAFDPEKEDLAIQLDRQMQFLSKSSSLLKAQERERFELKAIASRVQQDLTSLIDDNLVSLKKNDLWLEIEIKSSVLFPSGSVYPSVGAEPVLDKIAGILKTYKNQIQVEGFTDNVPITTDIFPSNWELSAARAASIVHLFTKAGIEPDRMSAVGYGEYKPVAPNLTESGRSKNRRVNIIILSDTVSRRINREAQLGKVDSN